MGRTSIQHELEQGGLFLSGDARLARTMHRWLRRSSYATINGIAQLANRGINYGTASH